MRPWELGIFCIQEDIYYVCKKYRDTNVKEQKERRDQERKGMMQRALVQFRTPQHPSSGTNHWGGASPLLARNVPKESLEQRYRRLNTIRTRDEIFPAEDDEFNNLSQTPKSKLESAPKPSRSSRGFLSMLRSTRKKGKAAATLGSNSKKKRWFPRWDPHNRWPQGWC